MSYEHLPLPPILPVGTQIVTTVDLPSPHGGVLYAKGAVGVITKAPVDHQHAYRIRLVDGYEESVKRSEIAVHSHFQIEGLRHPAQEINYFDFVIYRCVVGSKGYGLNVEGSDTDRRGIYLPPATLHWSLYGVPEQIDGQEEQYWELQKFLLMALKANPNVLECLYTPLVEYATPIAEELLSIRGAFLSKLVYQTYNGYVMSQFRKLNKDLENYGEIRWKHAMHLIRLLLAGITLLQEGFVPVDVGEYREKLLTIRAGEMPWEAINEWRLALHKDFDTTFGKTSLPERPDYATVNAFLVNARRSQVE